MITEELIARVKLAEKFVAAPYWDVKHYTVGYGHGIPESQKDVVVTLDQAEAWLKEDLIIAERLAFHALSCFDQIGQVRQDTLTEMQFQMGHLHFPEMKKAIERRDWVCAAHNVLWNDDAMTLQTELYKRTPARAERYAAQLRTNEA